MIETLEKFISLSVLGELALVVLATMGATQFIKVIARLTVDTKFDGLLIQATALVIALLSAAFTWTDHSGWIVGGLSAYAIASLAARYGLKILRAWKPDIAKMLQGGK